MERTKSADDLVGMPFGILQQASHLTTVCQKMPALNPEIKSIVDSLFDDMIAHEDTQQEFLAARRSLKETVTAMKAKASTSIAAAIVVQVDDHPEYRERQAACIGILDSLIREAKSLLARFQFLQGFIDVPSTLTLRKFLAEQHAVYLAFKKKYSDNANHNSCRWRDAPGAEFGLKPFEEIVFAWDGTVMVWDKDFDDWAWLEHYHPCRYMPGSDWGKFYYDLTQGDFWLSEQRSTVDWVHAAPAKALLDHLKADHRRANAGSQGEDLDRATTTGSIEKNTLLAASTGLPYPVYDDGNLQATAFDIDLGEVTTEKFEPSPGAVPRLDELNRKAREVATGEIPKVAAVQEHEEMVYQLDQ